MRGFVAEKEVPPPPVNQREIFAYMNTAATPETEALLSECLKEATPVLSYRGCYTCVPITVTEASVDFGFACAASEDLAKNLAGCKQAIVFAVTVGSGIDRLIARYEQISPAKALCFHAIGAERAETLCNTFNEFFNTLHPKTLHPRYSPGYGDLPLSFQHPLFSVLDCPRKIGLTLNESFLMSPSKSITAILGLEGKEK